MPISAPEIVVAISFKPQRRHAAGFRGELVVADGGEAIAQPRPLDDARGRDRDDRQHQHDQEQILDVAAEDRHVRRPDDVGAARAADEVPVDDQRLQHDGERERGDGEEGAAQPQRQIAGAEPDQARDDAADDDQRRDRQRQDRVGEAGERIREIAVDIGAELVQRHRRIGAEREERRRAEVHIAAIAAEDVPRGRQHDELQHGVAGEEQVVVAEPAREGKEQPADHDAADDRSRASASILSSQQSGRPERQRQQQKAERHRRRP